MSEDTIYKYLGYGVVGIFILCLIYYLWKMQFNLLYKMKSMTDNNNVQEGFTTASQDSTLTPSNSEEYKKVLETVLEKQKNNLLVGKNRRTYEDILINLDEWTNVQMFNAATSGAIKADKKDLTGKDIECINCVNGLAKFKKNLGNILEWMDTIKDEN